MNLVAHHGDRYFVFEIEWDDPTDPWAPFGRVYDRLARVLFEPIPFCRLDEIDYFFESWRGPESERHAIEEEASAAVR